MQDKIKNIDLLTKLTSQEFIDFCNKKLIPKLLPLENYRIQQIKHMKFLKLLFEISLVVTILSFAASFIISVAAGVWMEREDSPAHIFMKVGYSGLIFIMFCIWRAFSQTKPFYKNLKENFYNLIFSFLGNFKYYNSDTNSSLSESLQHQISSIKLFQNFNIYRCDDIIEGNYNGLNILVADLYLGYKVVSGKTRITNTVFDGILIYLNCNKNFRSTTVVRIDGGFLENFQISDLEKIKFDDPVFEKTFEVYSNDQIEARNLLTADFMNKLLKAQKRFKMPVTCSFEDGKMYIALHNVKDWFDVPIMDCCLTDIKTFQKILIDLITVLSVLETLQTDKIDL